MTRWHLKLFLAFAALCCLYALLPGLRVDTRRLKGWAYSVPFNWEIKGLYRQAVKAREAGRTDKEIECLGRCFDPFLYPYDPPLYEDTARLLRQHILPRYAKLLDDQAKKLDEANDPKGEQRYRAFMYLGRAAICLPERRDLRRRAVDAAMALKLEPRRRGFVLRDARDHLEELLKSLGDAQDADAVRERAELQRLMGKCWELAGVRPEAKEWFQKAQASQTSLDPTKAGK